MTNKYLVQVEYACSGAQTGGRWIIMEGGAAPENGVIDRRPFASGPLPKHDCRKYHDSQACENDFGCYWQEILRVLPFSEEEARRLNVAVQNCPSEKA